MWHNSELLLMMAAVLALFLVIIAYLFFCSHKRAYDKYTAAGTDSVNREAAQADMNFFRRASKTSAFVSLIPISIAGIVIGSCRNSPLVALLPPAAGLGLLLLLGRKTWALSSGFIGSKILSIKSCCALAVFGLVSSSIILIIYEIIIDPHLLSIWVDAVLSKLAK